MRDAIGADAARVLPLLDTRSFTFLIEDPATKERKRFMIRGPYVVRIPAGHPHTFINAGKQSLNLIGALPDSDVSYHELGPNPLIKR